MEIYMVGLGINAKKTKGLPINIEDSPPLHTSDGTELEWVDDFKYLVSWVEQTERDIAVRKSLAWQALNGMSRIWRSSLSKELKVRFFKGTVESILLYGCEAWALTEAMEHSLDGTYTRMLRKGPQHSLAQPHSQRGPIWRPPSCQQHNNAARRLQLAGHCIRHPELSAQPLVLWEPSHGRGWGRPKATYVDTLKRDTGARDADRRPSSSSCLGLSPAISSQFAVKMCTAVKKLRTVYKKNP